MMIDFIINEENGIVIAHDSKSLDGYTHLDVNMSDGSTVLNGPKGKLSLQALKAGMLEFINEKLKDRFVREQGGWLVRVNDYRLAKVSPLIISLSI